MDILEAAPPFNLASFKNLLSNAGHFLALFNSPGVQDLIRRANREYCYWDKFKYLPMPEGLNPEQAWVMLKIARRSGMKPLPIRDKGGTQFQYWQPDEVLYLLHQIDLDASGQLLIDEPGIDSSSKETYIISSLMEEAIASSQLEGAATTRRIAKEMLKSGRKPSNNAEQMILNNYITICEIQDLIGEKLSIKMLTHIHSLLTGNTLEDHRAVGRFRREDEDIAVVDRSDGQVLHITPEAGLLEERMQVFCNYANNDTEPEFIHPVIKAIVLHFWLAYDHPFVDGNGRTARAVFYWYLLSRKYWLVKYLAISKTILRAPSHYKKAFMYSENDENDLTYFIMYNLKAIRISILEVSKYLAQRQKEISELGRHIREIPDLHYRQYSLLQHALKHPTARYTFKTHINTHGISYQTARNDIFSLNKLNLLERVPMKGAFAFTPSAQLLDKIKHYSRPRSSSA